ncbi:MAG: hypothetical protein U9Q69_00920 [Nanoarchaeota archaeon]|nr:hypothetical protein [Nanoarchaeota archaeon]
MVKKVIDNQIKDSFLRVKHHILLLEAEIKANREFIIKQHKQILFLLERIKEFKTSEKAEFKQKKQSSSGNEGVYSFIHSFDIHSFNNHSDTSFKPKSKEFDNQTKESIKNSNLEENSLENINLINIKSKEVCKKSFKKANFGQFQGLKMEIESLFERLSKQELMTFLTIYQLEEEVNHVSYINIAQKLNLSAGCIRTYVSSLLHKGVPIKKLKYNNRLIFLKISPDFRKLNLKKQLMALYYRTDPLQPTLHESFS